MESESKNEVDDNVEVDDEMKKREVDLGSKAVETNDHLITDSNPELSIGISEVNKDATKSAGDRPQPETSKAVSKGTAMLTVKERFSQFLLEGMSPQEAIIKVNELLLQDISKVRELLPQGLPVESANQGGLDVSIAKSATANKTKDVATRMDSSEESLKPPGTEGASICRGDPDSDLDLEKQNIRSFIDEVSPDSSESAGVSVLAPSATERTLCAESKSKSLKSNYQQPKLSKSDTKVTANSTLKEPISRYLTDEISVREAITKVREFSLQYSPEGNADGCQNASVAKLANLSANNASEESLEEKSHIKSQQFNNDLLKVYNCWRERGLDHQDAWAKVQLLNHLTEESQKYENQSSDTWFNAPGFSSQVGFSPSDVEFVNHTRNTRSNVKRFVNKDFCSKGSINELPATRKIEMKKLHDKKTDSASVTPRITSAGPGVSSSGDSSVHCLLPMANLLARVQNARSILPLVTPGGSSLAVQAGILINGFSSGGIVNSLITSLAVGAQHLLAIPPVPAPVPASSSHLKRHHTSEELGVLKMSRHDELTNPPYTAQVQPNCKDPPPPNDSLHLCIVPSGYPTERLTDKQMDAIENSILEAILEIDDQSMKPVFKGSFRKKGRYEILCQNLLAKTWLDKYSSYMYEPWPGASLKIIPAAPESEIAAIALLPPCKNDDNDKILKYLGKQNTGLNADLWEVVLRSDGAANTSLTLLIDEESARVLKSKRNINFKLGSAEIELIEDPNTKHRESSKVSSDITGKTRTKMDGSGKERDSGNISSHGKRLSDEITSSRNSSTENLHLKYPRDTRHFSCKNSTEILNNASNRNYRMKVTENLEKNRRSVLSSQRSGKLRDSKSSLHSGVGVGKHGSSRSSSPEWARISHGRRHRGFDEPSKIGSSGLNRYMEPFRQDQPREYDKCDLPGSYGGLEGRRLASSSPSSSSRKQYEYADPLKSGPSSSRLLKQADEQHVWASRNLSPEYSCSIEPHSVPRQGVDKPTFGRSHSPEELSMYNEPSQHYQLQPSPEGRILRRSPDDCLSYTEQSGSSRFNRSASDGRCPSNNYIQESTERHTPKNIPSPEYRRSSDRLSSSRRYSSGQSPVQVRTQRMVRLSSPSKEPPDRSSVWRSDPPQRNATSRSVEYMERDRSPLGSSYLSRSENQRRSLRSPPPPLRLSKYPPWE